MILPITSEAATLREKFTSGAAKIYSKILGKKPTEKRCQDVFSTHAREFELTTKESQTPPSDLLNKRSDIPKVSDHFNHAMRNYLKLYYTQKYEDISPQVVNQAFRQVALQASKEGISQAQMMAYKKDIIQNNYADIVFSDQEPHEFIPLSEITLENENPTKNNTSFQNSFSISNQSAKAVQDKMKTVKLEPPENLSYSEASTIFPEITSLLQTIYGRNRVYQLLHTEIIDMLKIHQHLSHQSNIFEAETVLPIGTRPSNFSVKPKVWMIGNRNNSKLIAWTELKDTILKQMDNHGYSGDTLTLTDIKFYFHIKDKKSDTVIFVYLFHTPFGLQLGQSKLKIVSQNDKFMLPLIPLQSSELKPLVQNIETWIQNYNSLFSEQNHSLKFPYFNQRESRSWHYFDPNLRKIYLLFLPYSFGLNWFLPSEKLVRFVGLSLEQGTLTDIPLPALHAGETDGIYYHDTSTELRHYQSDYFEFTLNYRVVPSTSIFHGFKTQKIQLFRRSSIGPPVPPTESE
jgi:hypothetical protein